MKQKQRGLRNRNKDLQQQCLDLNKSIQLDKGNKYRNLLSYNDKMQITSVQIPSTFSSYIYEPQRRKGVRKIHQMKSIQLFTLDTIHLVFA